MFRNRRRTRAARVAVAGAAALLAVGIAACSSSSSSAGSPTSSSASATSSAAVSPGGTARVALPSGVTLNYIWPYTPLTNANEYNAEGFQMLMYRPLYMFGNNGPSVAVNYPLSLADAPTYSADGKTVTITMKGWKWSNGETVDAQGVLFWMNMLKADATSWAGYAPGPGQFPGDVVNVVANNAADTVTITTDKAYSSYWFTYNELSQKITSLASTVSPLLHFQPFIVIVTVLPSAL